MQKKTKTTQPPKRSIREDYPTLIDEQLRREWRKIARDFCMSPWTAYYCYFRRALPGERIGQIAFATVCPDGFELADPARISPAMTEDQMVRMWSEKSRRWPILGVE